MKLNWFFVGSAAAFTLISSGILASAQQAEPKTATGVNKAVVVPAQSEGAKEAGGLTPAEAEVLVALKQLMEAFNKGDSSAVLSMFLPDGELIDEEGTIYLGNEEIGALLKAFQEKYPGVKTQAEIESIRLVGGVALVDGTRVLTGSEGTPPSVLRFASVWKKTDAGYRLVSMRDVSEAIPATPHEALEPLAWLVGDWVNEGTDGKVNVNYRWAEDGNFILGDILVIDASGNQVMKSFQRIAWDAREGKYRSWTFDSDGGFGESVWHETETGWTMMATAVSPAGERGSAVTKLTPESNDRFAYTGTHRMTEGVEEPAYEYTVVRRPSVETKTK